MAETSMMVSCDIQSTLVITDLDTQILGYNREYLVGRIDYMLLHYFKILF